MTKSLEQLLSTTSALRESRAKTAHFVIQNPELFDLLLQIASTSNPHLHHRACWTLEWIFDEQPTWFEFKIETLFSLFCSIDHQGALRSISRIVFLLIEKGAFAKCTQKTRNKVLEKLTDMTIDSSTKVASKVYAMKALLYLHPTYYWIQDLLINAIEKDFEHQSPGYKAAARNILLHFHKTQK